MARSQDIETAEEWQIQVLVEPVGDGWSCTVLVPDGVLTGHARTEHFARLLGQELACGYVEALVDYSDLLR
jgi:hypothetical protein